MKKILVIEDEKELRENLVKILEMSGYSIISASGGDEGILLATEELPDLILCDVMMPGTDGYQVLKSISVSDKTKEIPFIFLTAKVEMRDLRQGMEFGADDYIFKPFRIDELVTAIESRLKRFDTIKVDSMSASGHKSESAAQPESIELQIDSGSVNLLFTNIKCVIGQAEFTRIKVINRSDYIIRKSISEWENLLPLNDFVRIHETTIINMKFIERIEKWFDNAYMIYLSAIQEPFFISKQFADRLKKS